MLKQAKVYMFVLTFTTKYDMQIPEAYAVKNVLIHYWYKGETGSITEYGQQIGSAMKALSSGK